MYQLLLTRRYLTGKVMPLLAAVAVMLCVATELIVWSVMGGFLDMLIASGRTLIGDVAISRALTGFPHYEDLIQRLEADPAVEAATPVIETFGLLSLPLSGQIETVMVKGIDPAGYDRVTTYRDTIWWKPIEKALRKDSAGEDPRLRPDFARKLGELEAAGRSLRMTDPDDGLERPAMVVGAEVAGYNKRMPGGWLDPMLFLPGNEVTLSVMPLDRTGRTIDVVARTFLVANENRSGVYEVDANTIFVPLPELQRMLKLHEARRVIGGGALGTRIDPATGLEVPIEPEVIGTDPARVTTVLVRAKEGVDASTLRAACERIYDEFAAAHEEAPHRPDVRVLTWKDRNRTLIQAVEKETAMVMFIFGIISFTSVFLVLAIFWSMVSEKTKDIGVLRAIGAGRAGVAGIWIGYGLAIGLVGAILGGLGAIAIVRNINAIHDWLGSSLGLYVWDPAVYYFSEIPSRVEPSHAAIVLVSGVLASALGALIPALKAALMDPVRALRFE